MNSEAIAGVLNDLMKELSLLPQNGKNFNERYLHHYFSQHLSSNCSIVFGEEAGLHPEWSTSKHGNVTYKHDQNGGYVREHIKRGWSGFIDFVIVNSDGSLVGIEFKCGESINQKGVVFDYQKLLDKDNEFSCIFSFVVCDRRKRADYQDAAGILKKCLNEAQIKLGDNQTNAECHLWYFEMRKDTALRIECNDIFTGSFTQHSI